MVPERVAASVPRKPPVFRLRTRFTSTLTCCRAQRHVRDSPVLHPGGLSCLGFSPGRRQLCRSVASFPAEDTCLPQSSGSGLPAASDTSGRCHLRVRWAASVCADPCDVPPSLMCVQFEPVTERMPVSARSPVSRVLEVLYPKMK